MSDSEWIISLNERDDVIRRQQKELIELRQLAYGNDKAFWAKKWYRLCVWIMGRWPTKNILSKSSYKRYRAGLASNSFVQWWWTLIYNLAWHLADIRHVERWR